MQSSRVEKAEWIPINVPYLQETLCPTEGNTKKSRHCWKHSDRSGFISKKWQMRAKWNKNWVECTRAPQFQKWKKQCSKNPHAIRDLDTEYIVLSQRRYANYTHTHTHTHTHRVYLEMRP